MIEELATVGGLVASGVFSLLLYLGSSHQSLLVRPLSKSIFCCGSLLSLVVALGLLNLVFGPAISVYIFLTIVMLVWSLLPFAAAYFKKERQEAADDTQSSRS